MPQRRYRAPEYYGAWVEGRYYNPGQLLPAGTTEIRVRDVEWVESREGYRTIHIIVPAGTDIDDIEAELAEGWEALEDYPTFGLGRSRDNA